MAKPPNPSLAVQAVIAARLSDREPKHAPPTRGDFSTGLPSVWRAVIDGFTGTLANANTKAAYAGALRRFFIFVASADIEHPRQISPAHIQRYMAEIGREAKPATQRQHLAALRALFASLVEREAIKSDPTGFSRLPPLERSARAQPDPSQIKRLIEAIKGVTLADLRDRALIALLAYGCARIGAVLPMRVHDSFRVGERRWIRLYERDGIRHELPAHPALAAALDVYLAARAPAASDDWLFAALRGGAGASPLSRIDAYRIIRKRAAEAGLTARIGCRSIRAGALRQYFANGGSIAGAQKLAGHKSPRSTLAYDPATTELDDEEIDRIRF